MSLQPKSHNQRSGKATDHISASVPLCRKQSSRDGAALVITLLVVSVLTVIVIGFLTSMSTERITSNSYAALTQAELAAEAGLADSSKKLVDLISANPWHGIGTKEVHNQLTPFFLGGSDTQSTPSTEEFLISLDASASGFTSANSTDLNIKRSQSDNIGWIGSPVDTATATITHRPARAHWVSILRIPSLPEQPNPATPNYNPVIARYAFWIEDESAKIDLAVTGNRDNAGAFERSNDGNRSADIDIGALPLHALKPLDYATQTAKDILGDILDFRNSHSGLLEADPRALNRASSNFAAAPDDLADSVKFHTTSFAISNDLAMTARRRANLNHIITNVNWGSDSNIPEKIAADLDDIGFIITGKHLMKAVYPGLDNSAHLGLFLDLPQEVGPLPDFGDRFFIGNASGLTNTQKQDIYLKKIAANIRDYIDSDSQPTFVDKSGYIQAGTPFNFALISGEEPLAHGKEAIPYLQEHTWRAILKDYQVLPDENGIKNRRSVSFVLDHYLDFYNPTTTDYIAPEGTHILIKNRPSFLTGLGSNLNLPDLTLDISGLSFPSGQATVITTCSNSGTDLDPPDFLRSSNVHRITVPSSDRVFTGIVCNEKVGSGSNTRYGLQMDCRSSSTTDYQTEFVINSPDGLLDQHAFIAVTADFSFTRPSEVNDLTRFIFATSMRGNRNGSTQIPSRSGDVRSMSEPLQYNAGSNSAFGNDQARFFSTITGGGTGTISVPGSSGFGIAHNVYIYTSDWPDYHILLDDNSATAPAIIRNQSILSIGELGHIYDPHRKASTEPKATILTARGGGRSLKIGQRDDLVPVARFGKSGATTSWFNAAWRLCDLFSADDVTKPVSEPSSRGKININGALRDNGVAIRSVLREFIFLNAPDGDVARAGRKMTDAEVDNLVEELINYLKANGPMLELGELSQLEFFAGAGIGNHAGGQPGSTSIDRSREEIFRRVVELITTRSLSFSLYCVGEAVRQFPDGRLQTKARSAIRRSIRLVPQTQNGGTFIDLDQAASPGAKASAFRVETLHESKLF